MKWRRSLFSWGRPRGPGWRAGLSGSGRAWGAEQPERAARASCSGRHLLQPWEGGGGDTAAWPAGAGPPPRDPGEGEGGGQPRLASAPQEGGRLPTALVPSLATAGGATARC